MRWDPATIGSGPKIWLLTIRYAGRDWRFAASTQTPIRSDGTPVPHLPGLSDVQVALEMSGPAEAPVFPDVSMSVMWPGAIGDLIAQGYDLGSATAELALWVEGTTYEQRRVYMDGPIDAPVYGRDGESLDLSITSRPWEGAGILPDPAAAVSADTWSGAPDTSMGEVYPEIIGRPGELDMGTRIGATPGIPVTMSGTDVVLLLIAGHPVDATTVEVHDRLGGVAELAVIESVDGLGVSTSTVLMTGSGLSLTQTTYDIAWYRDGGGGRMDDAGNMLLGAGSVLRYYLRRAGVRLDGPAWDAAVPRLDSIEISGYLQESVNVYDWLADQLLPLLPLELVGGTDGAVQPLLWQYDARPDEVIATLTEGRGVHLDDHAVTYSPRAKIINEYTLHYAHRRETDELSRFVTVGGTRPGIGYVYAVTIEADTSQHRYAVDPAERYVAAASSDAELLWSGRSAYQAAAWVTQSRALLSRAVTVTVDPDMGWLMPGDPVLLDLPSVGMSHLVAEVQRVEWAATDSVSYILVVYDLPSRDQVT